GPPVGPDIGGGLKGRSGRLPDTGRGGEAAHVPTDIEIAQKARLRPIAAIAEALGLEPEEWQPLGWYKAKITWSGLERRLAQPRRGRLGCVTAIPATPAGEGKACAAIGLPRGLGRLGHRVSVCLREPSLGPTFGIKGGAAGGGYAQVVP